MNRTELELLHNKIKRISTSEFEDWLRRLQEWHEGPDYDDGYKTGWEEGYAEGYEQGVEEQ